MSYLSICKHITLFQYHFLYLCSGGIEFFVCIFCKNDAPLWKLFISFQNINIAALCHWFRYKTYAKVAFHKRHYLIGSCDLYIRLKIYSMLEKEIGIEIICPCVSVK